MRTGRPSDGLDENGFRPKHILPKPESGVVLYFILDNRVAFGDLLLLESFAGLVVSDVAAGHGSGNGLRLIVDHSGQRRVDARQCPSTGFG